MPSPLDFTAIRKELDAFSGRLAALRAEPALSAAILELENAEEELRVCAEELERLAELGGQEDGHEGVAQRVFQEFPVPVFVLDASGVIRALNRSAAGLLGVSTRYTVGKPFAVFVEPPWRTTFRCELSDVLREGRPGSLACRLGGRGRHRPPPLELSLIRLGRPGDDAPLVLVTPDPFGERIGAEEAREAAPLHRLDVMARMTRLLLGGASGGGPAMLREAAALLATECADFVVVDLVRGGVIRRAVVAGHDAPAWEGEALSIVRALEVIDPDRSEISRAVVRTGESVLHAPIWEDGALGAEREAGAVTRTLSPGFAAAVAVRDETATLGALLLIRRSDRAAFTLTDLALYEELALHIGLALKR